MKILVYCNFTLYLYLIFQFTNEISVFLQFEFVSSVRDEEEAKEAGKLTKKGKEEVAEQWYEKMNYGPYLMATYEVGEDNFAYKGLAIRLDEGKGGVAKGNTFVVYDTDLLRLAAGWTGEGFVNWTNIAFDGSHTTHMSPVGDVIFTTPKGPGWASPDKESFEDDVAIDEFTDEIEAWVIDALKAIGCDTAKSVLDISAEDLVSRTDLEIETVEDVLSILSSEFED